MFLFLNYVLGFLGRMKYDFDCKFSSDILSNMNLQAFTKRLFKPMFLEFIYAYMYVYIYMYICPYESVDTTSME